MQPELPPLDIVDDRPGCPNCSGKLDERPPYIGTLPVLDCWECGRKYWRLPDGQIIEGPAIVRNPGWPKRERNTTR